MDHVTKLHDVRIEKVLAKRSALDNRNGLVPRKSTKAKTEEAAPAPAAIKTRPVARRAASKPTRKPPAMSESVTEPTDDEIRLRAYFIAEYRAHKGIDADSSADWLEAKRQLEAEASKS